MYVNNTQIAVKTFKGLHTIENNETQFINPVKVGMQITWASNTSGPATVKMVSIGTSNPDGQVSNVIYIDLDKEADPTADVFYLTPAVSGFQNMAPASLLTQGYQTYSNASPATQQALEFKLGQTAMAHQVQAAWFN